MYIDYVFDGLKGATQPKLTILKCTTEIEYEGIEPSSTFHVLDARFSQASVLQYGTQAPTPGSHSLFL